MKTQNTPQTEITESTQNNVAPEVQETKNENPSLWQSVLIGGIPGIMIGAGVTFAGEAIAKEYHKRKEDEPQKDTDDKNDDDPHTDDVHVNVAHSVTDDMSFNEAFAAARAEVGPGGAFVWHGQVYGTYRADDPEWQAMSDDERAEHSQLILSQVHGTPYTPPTHPADTTPGSDENGTETAPADGPSDTDIDVHIIGIEQELSQNGNLVTIGYASVDNHSANFIDTDGDGEVDAIWVDVNDNQQPDPGEYGQHLDTGIMVDQLAAASEAYNAAPEESIYNEMPDYTNDADTGSYV